MKVTLNQLLWLMIAFHVGFMLSLFEHRGFPAVNGPRRSYTNQEHPLETFNPVHHPVIDHFNKSAKLRVGLIVDENGPSGEGRHILHDGIVGSCFMDLVGIYRVDGAHDTFRNVQLWVIDNIRIGSYLAVDDFILSLFRNGTIPILVVDFHDDPRWEKYETYMRDLGVLEMAHVRIAQRSIVVDRLLRNESSIYLGHVMENIGTMGGPMLHVAYCVRNDIVDEIRNQTAYPPFVNRTLDVVHLWPVNDSAYFAQYRSRVSTLVQALNGRVVAGRAVKTSTKPRGEIAHYGRQTVSPIYVRTLLSAKIVVVTQRDMWEDSYRLMEGLAAGAMVLADFMLAPPHGIVDGIHLRFFSSLQQLEKLTLYYLGHENQRKRIAESGWRVAMNRHRSWHRMEQIVFGRQLTGHHYDRGS